MKALICNERGELMLRKYSVEVVVEVDDPYADDPEMEYAAVATAVAQAAQVLTHRAEGFDNPNVSIHVYEVV